MKIRAIKISNFLGIDELDWNPGQLNILEGPKGSGKSSVLEAIEKAFNNQGRRTELIKHGSDEATLYVATDTGLEIDRRLRHDKADYFKLRQEGGGIKSTEGELRKFLSGDIFRPLDFINLDIKEQTKIILNMIEMDYTPDEIRSWFGAVLPPGIVMDKHILQILKDIETGYYKEREEVNREIRSLEVQIRAIERELPANYDGDKWAGENVQSYYAKVSEAQRINQGIQSAKALKENFEDRVKAIEGQAEVEKSEVSARYRSEREATGESVELARTRIKEAQAEKVELRLEMETELRNVDTNLAARIQELKDQAEASKQAIQEAFLDTHERKDRTIRSEEAIIVAFEAKLEGLGEKEELELKNIDKETQQKIDHEKERLGKAEGYLDKAEPVDITPLQEAADRVAEMQSYLREWDRKKSIEGGLQDKKDYSEELTGLIAIARNTPGELLKLHKLPIEGISVDEEARIRINGTLLDGLSGGEKLEVAFKIALERMGALRIICLDGFEALNESEQVKILGLCAEHDIQAFVTITKDTKDGRFEIKQN